MPLYPASPYLCGPLVSVRLRVSFNVAPCTSSLLFLIMDVVSVVIVAVSVADHGGVAMVIDQVFVSTGHARGAPAALWRWR